MKLDERQANILQAIDSATETILSASHKIHDHPELGYKEVFASGLLTDILAVNGFDERHAEHRKCHRHDEKSPTEQTANASVKVRAGSSGLIEEGKDAHHNKK